MTTTANFSGGPGTFTIVDDTPAAIALLSTALTGSINLGTAAFDKSFGELAVPIINSPRNSLSALAVAAGNISTRLGNIDNKDGSLVAAIGRLNEQLATMTTGMASIQGTMSRQLITQQAAFVDQQRNNKFQQQATNAALKEAGKPEVVVKPEDFKIALEANVKDIATLNAQVASTAYVINLATETASDGLTYAGKWFLTTKVGAAANSFYLDVKKDATSFFSLEKTAGIVADAKDKQQELKVK